MFSKTYYPVSNNPSKSPGPRSFKSVVDSLGDGTLARAQWLEQVNGKLLAQVSPSLRHHIRVANVVGKKLVVLVESPLWHSKVRFEIPALLDAAQRIGLDAQEVTIKVAAPPAPPGQEAPTSVPMSAKTIRDLEAALGVPLVRGSGSNNPSESN